ncbi:MAG: hypothetical protein J0M15_11210 [Deltaproteobacteria bacterium]|nr:hypothetical protein [Deltaproteobacteria bacterium]
MSLPNGFLFLADNGVHGSELWKSDGIEHRIVLQLFVMWDGRD